MLSLPFHQNAYSKVFLGKYLPSTIGGNRLSPPDAISESTRAVFQLLWSGDFLRDCLIEDLRLGGRRFSISVCIFESSCKNAPSSVNLVSIFLFTAPISSSIERSTRLSISCCNLTTHSRRLRFSDNRRDTSFSRFRIRSDWVEFTLSSSATRQNFCWIRSNLAISRFCLMNRRFTVANLGCLHWYISDLATHKHRSPQLRRKAHWAVPCQSQIWIHANIFR